MKELARSERRDEADRARAILFDSDVNRLPVRPAVYAQAPAGTVNPFATPLWPDPAGGYRIDQGLARQGLVIALFEAAITRRSERLRDLWRRIHAAEQQAARIGAPAAEPVQEARLLASWVPVSATDAADPVLLDLFAPGRPLPAAAAGLEVAWTQALEQALGRAEALMQITGAEPPARIGNQELP